MSGFWVCAKRLSPLYRCASQEMKTMMSTERDHGFFSCLFNVIRIWIALVLLNHSQLVTFSQTPESALAIVSGVSAKNNKSLADEDGDFPGYIVVRNNLSVGTNPIDLSGHMLTTSVTQDVLWIFGDGIFLPPQSELIIFASGKDRLATRIEGQNHTNFTFPCDIPYVALLSPKRDLLYEYRNVDPSCLEDCGGIELFSEKTISRYLVPENDDLNGKWMDPNFDDKNWNRGPLGIGYENLGSHAEAGPILYATMDRKDVDIDQQLVKDISGSRFQHDAKAKQKIGLASGQVQEAIQFDSRQALWIDHHDELDPALDNYSFSIWVLSNSIEDEVIASKGGVLNQASGWSVFNRKDSTIIQFNFSKSGVVNLVMPRLKTGQWSHLLWTIDRRNQIAGAYLNGKLVSSARIPQETLVSDGQPLVIGETVDGKIPFSGRLDECAIWKSHLSSDEIIKLTQNGLDGNRIADNSSSLAFIYNDLIKTETLADMFGKKQSLYLRVPFQITDPTLVHTLQLSMHYDDGFICYLNGHEVVRRNAGDAIIPTISQSAQENRLDSDALLAETFNLHESLEFLVPGINVLAIHGVNASVGEDRFLIKPKLCLGVAQFEDCVRTTNGREFWLTFPGNAPDDESNPTSLSLSIGGSAGTNVRVDIPGIGYSKALIIPPNSPLPHVGLITLGIPKEMTLDTARKVENKGVRVLADRPVSVYGTSRIDYSTDTFLGLPNSCLGIEYVALAYKNVWEYPSELNGSQVAIVAPYNNTIVKIIPPGANSWGITEIKLDEGQTYLVREMTGPLGDLSGTRITSNFPVGVFAGHKCANIDGNGSFFCDNIVEQILPVADWGTQYYNAPLSTRVHDPDQLLGDTLRVISSQDDTFVTIHDATGAKNVIINSNQVYEQKVIGASYIRSQFPILASVFSNSSDSDGVSEADPFMALLQPEASWLSRYVVATPPTLGGAEDFEQCFINLVVRNSEEASAILLNGSPVLGFLPLADSGYLYAQVTLDPSNKSNVIVSRISTFGLTVYGFSAYDSFGYPGGMQFTSPRLPFVACPPVSSIKADENCVAVIPDLRKFVRYVDPCEEPDGSNIFGDDCFELEDLENGLVLNDMSVVEITSMFGTHQGQVNVVGKGGSALITQEGRAGGSGNEINGRGVHLVFASGSFSSGVSFKLGVADQDSISLGVNRDIQARTLIGDFDGAFLGGCSISVIYTDANQSKALVTIYGNIENFSVGSTNFFIDSICPVSGIEYQPAGCFELEDQETDLRINNTDRIVTFDQNAQPLTIVGQSYQYASGNITETGFAVIRSGTNSAGHLGKEIQCNNILLGFIPESPIGSGVTVAFGELGGNINLSVNGFLSNANDFKDLHNQIIGGAKVTVLSVPNTNVGVLKIEGLIQEFGIGGQELFIDNICLLNPNPSFPDIVYQPAGCFEFEEHEADLRIANGGNLVAIDQNASAITVVGQPYQYSSGNVTETGFAVIRSGSSSAGHEGKELQCNNIMLSFYPEDTIGTGLTISFGEYGGNINLSVNGVLVNTNDFVDLHNQFVGGARVIVTQIPGSDKGILNIQGVIQEFGIGGQELFIDHLCIQESTPSNPEFNLGDLAAILPRAYQPTQAVGNNRYIVTQDPPFGTIVSIGNHPVSFIVKDENGRLVGSCATQINVIDRSPVNIVCPENIFVSCETDEGAYVFWDEPIAYTERCHMPVNVLSNHRPGDFFKIGKTTVTLMAENADGSMTTCSFLVSVSCDSPAGNQDKGDEDPIISADLADGGGLTLNWPEGFRLESSKSISGPWKLVPEAKPPLNIPFSSDAEFFRVRR